eukprot:comp22973_c0_seq1/m.36524 comp22973_c0_seq1/g.36524  ORF comp22973_c0_seq1/g.36524 comp22973_c0_seq1/m.36524 type:complete len:496 (-) comp22973_c0_seq1:20-1507(-)
MEAEGHLLPHPTGRLTGLLALAAATATLGATFQVGFSLGELNNTVRVLQQAFGCVGDCDTPSASLSWAVSVWAIGGMLGGLAGGLVADRLGRRLGLAGAVSLCMLGSGLQVAATGWGLFMAGRAVSGFGGGVGTIIVPIYLAEIAPTNLRGALGTLNQLAITCGILAADTLSVDAVLPAVFGDSAWKWLFGLALALAGADLLLLPFCPESPAYLFSRGDKAQAALVLRALRGTEDVAEELAELHEEMHSSRSRSSLPWSAMLRTPGLPLPLAIGLGLQVGQQLSGINSLFFYSTSILQGAHIIDPTRPPHTQELAKQMSSAGLALVNVAATLVAVGLMDRAGRRRLLLVGFYGQALCYGLLALALALPLHGAGYLALAAMVGAIFAYALGPGPIPWLLGAEIFPLQCREKAMAAATATNWLMTFVIGRFFPPLHVLLGHSTFALFAGLCVLFGCGVLVAVPETKGKTGQEIHQLFLCLGGHPAEATPLLGPERGQ